MIPGQVERLDARRDDLAQDDTTSQEAPEEGPRLVRNFFVMSILFGANHGTIVSCLSLATARMGAAGALQAGVMYLFYTLASLFGATYVVQRLGSRNAMTFGMTFYTVYITCFALAIAPLDTQLETSMSETVVDYQNLALVGAAFGGIGVGILWVGQGAYFVEVANRHAAVMVQDEISSHSYFAGIFGFVLLAFEALLRALSSVLIYFLSWGAIFGIYTTISILSTLGMWLLVVSYPKKDEEINQTVFEKVTAALQLMAKDPKMKYMIGINLLFGFGGAFMNSYINGQVVAISLADIESHFVGVLTSWTALVAGLISLATAVVPRKGPVMVTGIASFFFVSFSFLVQPDAALWNIYGLVTIFTLQGVGRAAFESTLKAVFADFFEYDSIGAFSNLILQNGVSSSVGYVLTYQLSCADPSRYCVLYTDGTMHDVFTFPLLICLSGILALFCYWRANVIFRSEGDTSAGDLKGDLLTV